MERDHTTNPLLTLAARLERARQEHGMPLEVLAERSGLPLADVKAILAGGNAGVSVVIRLAGALKLDPARLLSGIAWKPDDSGGRFEIEESDAGKPQD